MITDDNVWELFQRADPARRPDISPITDAATYLEGLRSSDAAVTRIDDAPSSRGPTWLGWPLASAAAIAAVIAAGALVLVTRDDEQSATVEVATASVSEAPPPMPYFHDVDTGARTAMNSVENAYDFQPSPDGTRMLFYQGGALSIANADGSGVVAIDVQASPEWRPARWSPDSTHIVYQERQRSGTQVGNLYVHEVATGQRTQVTDLDLTTAGYYWLAPSFSPDGQSVVFHLARDASDNPGFDVWSVPVTGGDPELLVEDAVWPMYLPDGGLVYVTSSGGMVGDALVIAAADGSTRTLTEAVDGIAGVTVSPNGARVAYGDEQIHVVEVESGEATMLEGTNDAVSFEWLDDHTLLFGGDS
jgi:WD40-like Beta Propeller Repeat